MTNRNLPSKDPADQTTMAGMLHSVFRKQMQGIDGQLPARVIKVINGGTRAVVQPLIAVLSTDGTTVSRAPIASIPVLTLGSGGFALTFPLKAGDSGWIEASDRDISLFLQAGGKEARPNSIKRMHSFEDGRFVPDVFANAARVEPGSATLQTLDGAVRVSVSETGVRLTAGEFFFELDMTTGIASNAPWNNTGAGSVELPANTKIGDVLFTTHEHANGALPGGKSAGPSNP